MLAKSYLHGALTASANLTIGGGAHGPLHHGYARHAWPPPPPTGVGGGGYAPAPRLEPLDLSVYAITDAALNAKHGRTIGEAVRAAIAGGATVVQLREKGLAGGALVAAAREAVAAARPSGVPLLVNDRIDVAMAAGAAGVHLGQEDVDVATARRLLGPHAIIGATAKTPALARAAIAMGADYIGATLGRNPGQPSLPRDGLRLPRDEP